VESCITLFQYYLPEQVYEDVKLLLFYSINERYPKMLGIDIVSTIRPLIVADVFRMIIPIITIRDISNYEPNLIELGVN